MDFIKYKRFIDVKGLITAFTVTRSENYVFKGESHDFWEMVYVSKGSVGVAEDGRILKCTPGTVIFHKPNAFHRIWNAGRDDIEFSVISFVADGECMNKLCDKVVYLDVNGLALTGELQDMLEKYSRDEEEYMPTNFYKNDEAFAKFCSIFEHFLYACAESKNEVRPRTSGNASIFTAAVNKMRENISQQIKVQQIADELHISLAQLKRIFKKYTLKGVHEYFLTLKIEEAKTMLAGGCSVYDTAMAVGFYNQNYFSAAFKREVGITPSEWARKNQRVQNDFEPIL